MRKPRNRSERIDFIIQKCGLDVASGMYKMTDRKVKEFCDAIYQGLKDGPDYKPPKDKPAYCLRCGTEVTMEFNQYCDCGKNNAVLTEDDFQYVGEPDE